MSTVYVRSLDGKTLMPTTRCGHVRLLLKQGKARVVDTKPFTVQLLYEMPDATQDAVFAFDEGRTNIGGAAVLMDGTSVLAVHLETRNKEIPRLMAERKTHRQAHRRNKRRMVRRRRAKANGTEVESGEISRVLPGCRKPVPCKGIRNKEARFNNRPRPEGWLTPTAEQLVETHLSLLHKVMKYVPVTDVCLEVNKFAFMALDDPTIWKHKQDFQNGPLKGYAGVNAAVDAMQDGKCLLCGDPIEHHHHMLPRRKRGSDTLRSTEP